MKHIIFQQFMFTTKFYMEVCKLMKQNTTINMSHSLLVTITIEK